MCSVFQIHAYNSLDPLAPSSECLRLLRAVPYAGLLPRHDGGKYRRLDPPNLITILQRAPRWTLQGICET